jgi:glycosyltransferase involved in cell wall biosynthesis
VVCISRTTADDAAALWGVARQRIVVAALGPGQELPPGERAQTPSHFLYVGDDEPRKNLGVLLESYRRYRTAAEAQSVAPLELVLVLAGDVAVRGPGVRVIAGPGAAQLAQLYRGAAALVHPSLYEGFGLTAVEAMSLGTPVLAARSPGIVEVCAEAAGYAEPNDPSGFADAMAELAQDPARREQLAQRGRARAADFSWSDCAAAHVAAYCLACSG